MNNIFATDYVAPGSGGFGKARRKLIQEQGEFARTLRGYISGVLFDFQHVDLAPGRWEIPGPVSEKMFTHEGFYISKAGAGRLPAVLADLSGEDPQGGLDSILAEAEFKAKQEGMIILRPNDCVKVSLVEVHELPDAEPFASEPDRFGALVHFTIHRADGALDYGGHAWLFHSACMVHGLADGKARRVLLKRLNLIAKGAPPAPEDEALGIVVDLAARLDERLDSFTEALWKQQEKLEGGGLLAGLHALGGPAYDVEEVVNLAVLYGYRQGHLEASRAMKPMAEAGYEKRRAELLRGWEARDREKEEFAATYWARYTTATLYEVLQQYNARPGAGAPISAAQFNEAVGHICPSTSSSYTKPAVVRAREKQKERHFFGIY